MKYIATVTDGSFPTNSAVIQAPIREAFAMAKAAGYDGLQLTIRDTTDYDIAQLQALMQETGLEITALATGRIYSIDHMSLGAGDESVRQGAVARMNKIASWSVPLGCPGLVIGAVRGNYSDAGSIDLYMSQLEKSIREIVAYCEPLKVPVILEVIDRNESRAFCDPEETRKFVEKVGSPYFSLYLDTMHLYRERYDVSRCLREYAPFAFQIDISGEDRKPPMESVIDFRDAVHAIVASGYDGIINFEIPAEQEKPVSLDYIRKLVIKEERARELKGAGGVLDKLVYGKKREGLSEAEVQREEEESLREFAGSGKLKNLIFDVGNVLFSYIWPAPLTAAGTDPEEALRITKLISRSHLWPLFDYGVLTVPELVEKYSLIYPDDADSIARWFEGLHLLPVERPAVWDRLHLLKEAGYHLYILSNYGREIFEIHTKDRPFPADMDGMVVSGYIHMGKPEARIYRYLLDTYALDPAECVFFDDRDVNCTAGEAVGIRSLQILSEEQLIRILDLLLSEAEKA